MTAVVMVDEIRIWPTSIRCFKKGSAHLTSSDVEALHAFAAKIGLRREWFQDGRVPHYDLTPRKHDLALVLGAKFVPARVQAAARIAAQRPDV